MILTLTHAAHGGSFDLPTASLLYWSPVGDGRTQLRLRDGSTMDVKESPPEVRRMYEQAVGAIAHAQAAPMALLGSTARDAMQLTGPTTDGDPSAPRVLSIAGPAEPVGNSGWDDAEAREHAAALFGENGEYSAELLVLLQPMLATHGTGAAIPCSMLAAGIEAGHASLVAQWDARGLILAMGCALTLALEGFPVTYQQGAGPVVTNRNAKA